MLLISNSCRLWSVGITISRRPCKEIGPGILGDRVHWASSQWWSREYHAEAEVVGTANIHPIAYEWYIKIYRVTLLTYLSKSVAILDWNCVVGNCNLRQSTPMAWSVGCTVYRYENRSVSREEMYLLYSRRRSQRVLTKYTLFIYSSFEARSVDVYQQSLAPRHRFLFELSPL